MKKILFLWLPLVLFMLPQGNLSAQTVVSDSIVYADTTVSVVNTAANNIVPKLADSTGTFTLSGLFRGLLGMLSIIFIAWIFSTNRKKISWSGVGIGLLIQISLAVSILYVKPVRLVFEFIGKIFVAILNFSASGSEFLLGGLMNVDTYGFIFAFQVLPTIIFFSALTSLLFYLGVIQKVVYVLAWLMTKALKLSGAESLSVAGNIFLGQTESPLMIKAYLEKMNRSEILLVMIGGMATL
ncbi:MAG: Na+ dependent nucleoside transporter N-terminal domain-containing protein, partial [Lentimicrobiaceae bacterium]|nr:Na+ dependent nucleoside transporter N-terminal domain-containing protein [Lentimicrobiaceae bacterium]